MGILPCKVLCNAVLSVFHISLLKVALSKVFDPDIEMKGKSGADLRICDVSSALSETQTYCGGTMRRYLIVGKCALWYQYGFCNQIF